MKKVFMAAALGAVLIGGGISIQRAEAHGVWFAPRLGETRLVLGEGYKDDAYSIENIAAVKGFDAEFSPVSVMVVDGGNFISIRPTDDLAVAVVDFDFGYWSNDAAGKWHNRPMDEVRGSTVGTHAVKYSVNYLKSVKTPEPIEGLPFQIVPMSDPTTLEVGDPLTVQVLRDGKPLPGAEIIPDVINHHTVTVKTDAEGKYTFNVPNGSVNVIGLELAVPYDKPTEKATRDKVFASLSFTLYPAEKD